MRTTALTREDRTEDIAAFVDAAPEASTLTAIDETIARFAGRTNVPASEVVDVLLDIRLAVAIAERVTQPA